VLPASRKYSELTKLGHGTAPGSNGLRPELFKTGGNLLAERITDTYSKLGRMLMLSPCTNKRGDPTDPGNYSGIFLLDVAGKVLTSVIDKRLKVLIEETVRDSQHGLRKSRSTSHLIHVMRHARRRGLRLMLSLL
jgi:hypothetical protein